ncbi:MAG: lipoprotein [Paracoccaceae bacterium]|nr:MAG: lipoprotein [Paracoccaceae bacterium]
MIGQSMRPGIRRGLLVAVLLALGSCSLRAPDGPVSDPADACTILRERPHWYRAAREAEARWGVPTEVLFAIIWRESGFRADARTRRTWFLGFIPTGRESSAHGFAQAIDGTWDWYRRETGNRHADREDFRDAADFVGWYTARTARVNNVPQSDAFHQYLAYHEGHAGYRRGDWRQKPALQRAALQVSEQARRYRSQLERCA